MLQTCYKWKCSNDYVRKRIQGSSSDAYFVGKLVQECNVFWTCLIISWKQWQKNVTGIYNVKNTGKTDKQYIQYLSHTTECYTATFVQKNQRKITKPCKYTSKCKYKVLYTQYNTTIANNLDPKKTTNNKLGFHHYDKLYRVHFHKV